MKFWPLLVIAVEAGVSRRCVTHHGTGALLRDPRQEGELIEDQEEELHLFKLELSYG